MTTANTHRGGSVAQIEIAATTLRRRLISGDTYARIGADMGLSADAVRKRAGRLGVTSTMVLGRHRRRPMISLADLRARKTRRASRR